MDTVTMVRRLFKMHSKVRGLTKFTSYSDQSHTLDPSGGSGVCVFVLACFYLLVGG